MVEEDKVNTQTDRIRQTRKERRRETGTAISFGRTAMVLYLMYKRYMGRGENLKKKCMRHGCLLIYHHPRPCVRTLSLHYIVLVRLNDGTKIKAIPIPVIIPVLNQSHFFPEDEEVLLLKMVEGILVEVLKVVVVGVEIVPLSG